MNLDDSCGEEGSPIFNPNGPNRQETAELIQVLSGR